MKKILYCFVVIVIFISIVNVNNNLQKNVLPDIFIANVEALASSEGGNQVMKCYSNVVYTNDGRPVETQTYCGDCMPIRCTSWSNQISCTR
jgi:hypothetical protein